MECRGTRQPPKARAGALTCWVVPWLQDTLSPAELRALLKNTAAWDSYQGLMCSLGTVLMLPVIVSSGFLHYYFFAKIVKTAHLEQMTCGILKFNQSMLTIINCTGNKHTDPTPAGPTALKKPPCLVLHSRLHQLHQQPHSSQTLNNISHPGIWHNMKIIFK